MRLLLIASLLAVSSSAVAAKSVVGLWAFADGNCLSHVDTFFIGPKSIQADELSCEFKTVRREGATVFWTDGNCSSGGDPWPQTATAVDGPRGLMLRFGKGAPNGPLKSCPRPPA